MKSVIVKMQIYLATTNTNKIKEIQNFLDSLIEAWNHRQMTFEVKDLRDIKGYIPPEETGRSFKDNAFIKSQHLFKILKEQSLLLEPLGILAEDSGLEVESLKGEPGIYSARYSGLKATDRENNRLLLKNLEAEKNRRACYVCSLSFLLIKEGETIQKSFEDYCEGQIACQEKGKAGFGYDPLFIPEGETKSFGELPFSLKQKMSHRARALNQWKDYINQISESL